MMACKVLVAGVGNIFLSDDGWGVEVANRIRAGQLPDGVRVMDVGIRSVHLAYELLEGCGTLLLVDAMPMGERPGTVALFEPAVTHDVAEDEMSVVDAHGMGPSDIVALVGRLRAPVGRVLVVGCEPESLDEGIGLSQPVAAAVERGVALCRSAMRDALINETTEVVG